MTMSLSVKQNNFLINLLMGLPQHEAYINAGYNVKSNEVAASNASTLLRNPKFSKYYNQALEGIRDKITKPLEVTRDRILNEYSKLAFLDPRQFYDKHGNLVPIHKLDADTAAAVAGMDVQVKRIPGDSDGVFDETVTTKIKLADKKASLDSLARVLGMFNDKVQVGIDQESIDKALSALPSEFACVVKAAITAQAQAKIEDK